jgi:acyl-[acyl-carrier-protein] desaturase
MNDAELLHELQPKVAELLDRHLKTSKEWFPHTFVPWERGVELNEDTEWDPRAFPLPDAVRSALFVNLLTEDNLPYYHAHIARVLGRKSEAWLDWNHRWTAEEARHSMVIRDYLVVTQAIDPFVLERARMHQMSTAVVPEPPTIADTLAYVALQELATRISHRNTGKMLNDEVGMDVMARVAKDENFHFLFYRDAFTELMAMDPSTAILALERQVRDFKMPGVGIPDFNKHAHAIAQAGIYDLMLHHDQILQPVVMRHYGVENLEGLTDEAEKARLALITRIARTGKAARRLAERSEQDAAEAAAKASA